MKQFVVSVVLANYQISANVISSVLVNMVHRMALREKSAYCLLRYQNVLRDISKPSAPRMPRNPNVDVSAFCFVDSVPSHIRPIGVRPGLAYLPQCESRESASNPW
jgi:hypothetical protein